MQPPALFVKPAAEIMKPIVLHILQESEEFYRLVDSHDVVVSFMEHCRERIPEEISVRVFESLANRAQLLVDTLTKSPLEFWKVWSVFYVALTDFAEPSPVFESAVFLFKRIGELMRDSDPLLTQHLITEVALPSLAKELVRAPEKREALCEIIYSYTQAESLSHLVLMRALKDKVRDLSIYASCLSCLIPLDAHLSLLDDHLLDLYIYYAMIAIQSPQPKARVAGISILSTIASSTRQHDCILALVPAMTTLANDDWWEVQAQLLLLVANILSKLTAVDHQEAEDADDAANTEAPASSRTGSVISKEQQVLAKQARDEQSDQLLGIIGRLFVVSNSKNVLQVGLSALVHQLNDYPTLLPMFVTVLLEQPVNLRQRLLQTPGTQTSTGDRLGRLTYVMGNASRMYEEQCISEHWPRLDVAKTFVMQLEASPLKHLELEHVEVFLASLPEQFEAQEEADEWLQIFEKLKQYIIVALMDPHLHRHSTEIVRRFWLAPVRQIAEGSVAASMRAVPEMLALLYGTVERAKISEDSMLDFLRDIISRGGVVGFEVKSIIESFRDTYQREYAASQLHTLLA
eukprot:NODE_2697_length_2164_cov_4.188513.p1 GENE.NODE_2697_length_2164_cov_4.188513~~NODE_2697_length_2164_cov_4.188513.p1  ORF type:complete len:640 (-),score=205.91 NODE_2697_length_2164_cov_4.188513:245-1969(-)